MYNGGTALHPYPAAVSRQKSIIPGGHLAFEKYFLNKKTKNNFS
jgi:hypothetical protein